MGHGKCGVCQRRIPSNQAKRYLGTKSLWKKVCQYGVGIGKVFDPEALICKKCHACIWFRKTNGIRQVRKSRKKQNNTNNDSYFDHDFPSQDSEINIGNHSQTQTSVSSNSYEDVSTQNTYSQSSVASVQSTHTNASTVAVLHNSRIKLNLNACSGTQRCCFICRQTGAGKRCRIPESAIVDLWVSKQMIVPFKNRCCKDHISKQGKFDDAAKVRIVSNKKEISFTSEEIKEFICALSTACENSIYSPLVDFDTSSNLTSSDYQKLTALSREDFDDLFQYCKPHLKDSANRSSRNGLGMFLMKLRLNISQEVLGILFKIKDQSKVSLTIESVRNALEKTFTIKYLGYNHLTREAARTHQSRFPHTLLGAPDDSMFVIIDGTYLYVQKPSDFELQKKTFSLHKNRNLLKPMMVVFPDGYILEAEGLFFADNQNNDAKIFSFMLDRPDGFSSFFVSGDYVVVDRGFRDVISKSEEKGFKMLMPHLLERKEKQFSTDKANQSRIVTMIRFIVESANGRVKNMFHMLSAVIPASSIPKLGSYFRIACALINAYSPPLFTATDQHIQLAQRALLKLDNENLLRKEIEDSDLIRKTACWKRANKNDFPDFPILTENDLELVTLGKYQIGMALLYTSRHLQEDSSYSIYVHKDKDCLIRAKMESRYGSKGKSHQLWLKYKPEENTAEGILAYYCLCKVGSRVVGTCSHVTSVIWFLGFARYNEQLLKQRKSLGDNIINAVDQLCDIYGDDEREENQPSENAL